MQINADLQRFSTIVLAYSGGLDSQVLLHQLAAVLSQARQLIAVHVNHGLSVHASEWQQHCEQSCKQLGIPLHVESLALNPAQSNLEAVARTARYAALKKYIQANSALVTAHHQDDQCETLFLQLLRGAGPRGLAAMPLKKKFAEGVHIRPLLNWTRAALTAYAHQHQLTWCEDDSNTNPRFDRNFLRHQIFPLLQQRWPTFSASVARSAEWCAEASSCLSELAKIDLAECAIPPEGLRIDGIRKLSLPRQANLLREWLRQAGFPIPDSKHLARVINEVINAKVDANPLVTWENIQVRRFRNTLYAMQKVSEWDPSQQFVWDLHQDLTIPNLGTLRANGGKGEVTVRFRQGGERFSPTYGTGTRSLKKCFQDWEVPPWLRDRVPLLYFGDQLIAVVGYAVAKGFEDWEVSGIEGQIEGSAEVTRRIYSPMSILKFRVET